MSAVTEVAPTAETTEPAAPTFDRLPRVNLLPPELAEGARLRRIQLGLGGGLLVAVGAIAALYVGSLNSVSAAEQELAAISGQNAALQAKTTQFDDVEGVHAAAAAARTLLSQALGQEVRYSQFLDDLTLTVPERVWLQDVSFSQTPPSADGAQDALGTVTFTGVGQSHDDVAAWLESLTPQKGYADPYFSGATSTTVDGRRTVRFTSTVTLTSAALSGRYTAPSGG